VARYLAGLLQPALCRGGTWLREQHTSASNFLNSSSFCFRYASTSFLASSRASFTRFVRSTMVYQFTHYPVMGSGAYIHELQSVSIHPGAGDYVQVSKILPLCTIFPASFSACRLSVRSLSSSTSSQATNLEEGLNAR
jgi:hypothetical protein